MADVAAWLVLAAGSLILVVGVYGFLLPERLMALAARFKTPGALWLAVLIRVVLGVAMILAAPISRLPAFLTVFGGLVVIAGLAIPLVGTRRIGTLIDFFLRGSAAVVRMIALVAALFGVFMVWVIW